MVKTLLVGYNGHQNLGDDLLLQQAYQQLLGSCHISIWTNAPMEKSAYLEQWFPEAEIVRSKSLSFRIFRRFDKVLYFGGGVFFDYDPDYALLKYAKKKTSVFIRYHLSRLTGTRFAGIGIGLGPFLSARARDINRSTLSAFDLVGVRDVHSKHLLSEYQIDSQVVEGFDLSFLQTKSANTHIEKRIIICPRKFSHQSGGDAYHQVLAEWASKKQEEGYQLIVYGFQPHHDEDILTFYEQKGLPTRLWNPDEDSVSGIINLFAHTQLIISARMHGVYLAGIAGRPSVGINVHPKVKHACSLFVSAVCLPIRFNIHELEDAVQNLTNTSAGSSLDIYKNSAQEQYQIARDWILSGRK